MTGKTPLRSGRSRPRRSLPDPDMTRARFLDRLRRGSTALAVALVGAIVGVAADPLAAQSAGDLAASLSFQPAQVASGKPTQMRVRLRNTNDGTISAIHYDAVFAPGMRLVGTPDPFQCKGGTVTPVAGGYQLRGAFLDFSDNTCDVVVDVAVDTDTDQVIDYSIGPIESRNGTVSRISATLTVSGGIAPRIVSPPIATPLELGVPFTHNVAVTGTAPVVVTATGLPPGLAYDDAVRRVSGAPTAVGLFTVTLRATNGFLPADAQVSTVEVRNPPLTIVTPPPLAPAPILAGFPATFDIVATGGLPPYRFELGGGTLPPGLAIGEGGRIAGTPTIPGTYGFVVRVRDVLAQQDTRAYELTVERIPTTLKFSLAPNPAVVGQAVVLGAQVVPSIGPPPPGTLEAWAAGPGSRCPAPFETGGDPVTGITRSSAFAGGLAQVVFEGLGIGRFRVCASYSGGPLHQPSSIGPVDLYLIKGVLLPSPKLRLELPTQATAGAVLAGLVQVEGTGGTGAPGGTVHVRAGTRDLGELPIADGVARFAFEAPTTAGTLAVTASYAGDAGNGPASAEPAYVMVVKASLPEAIPASSGTALVLTALALAVIAAVRGRRRR